MPTYEENAQTVLDLRARVLDPEQENPSPEEVWAAVHALHATRGIAATKKVATNKTIDIFALFNKPGDKPEEAGDA